MDMTDNSSETEIKSNVEDLFGLFGVYRYFQRDHDYRP